MKTISVALQAHYAGGSHALAKCLKMTRRDDVVMAATTHDQDIVFDGVTYLARSGGTMSDVENTAALAVDNSEMRGLLNLDSITEVDLRAGLYDYAAISVFEVNYTDLTQGKRFLMDGWIGQVTTERAAFIAELRGLCQALSRTIGRLCSPLCSAKLGDDRCQKDLTGDNGDSPPIDYTVTGTLDAVGADNCTLTDAARTEPGPSDGVSGWFDYGVFTATSGLNVGLSMEVKTYVPGEWILQLPMPYALAAGDTYSMVAGCDKRITTCNEKFDNVAPVGGGGFRGRPYVPGQDKLVQVGRHT